jgi:SAM-dependent methyltransferase
MTTQHAHGGHVHGEQIEDERAWWEARYGEQDRIWSGRPNALLVREVEPLPPGRALELGCGEGADSIWLAQRGWQVTAVDISATALARAARHVTDAGVADRVDLQEHDLATSLPGGTYDLVCAQYYHSPVTRAGVREDVLRRAAAGVAPGGHLLVVGHASWPSWVAPEDRPDVHFPTTTEVRAGLEGVAVWEVVTDEEVGVPATSPDGEPGTRYDNLVHLQRAGS